MLYSIRPIFSLLLILKSCFCAPSEDIKPKIIVIGAGPAGIAASSKLYSEGFDVQVLEAEDRIGGRINSVKFGDAYVDMGAEWCHGEEGNTVFNMVKDLNILHSEHNDTTNIIFYHSNGTKLDDDFMGNLLFNFDSAFRGASANYSFGQFAIKKFSNRLKELYPDTKSEEYRMGIVFLDSLEKNVLAHMGAFSWFDASAVTDYRQSSGNDLNWNGKGYKTIIEIMLKKFPQVDPEFKLEEQILLNKEVVKIEHDNQKAKIYCADKSSYTADHVIFTPSLGVLKHDHESLFTPALNQDKITAIKNLGIAAVTKVMMHFSEPWWDADVDGYFFQWALEDKVTLAGEFVKGPVKCGKSWLENILGFYTLKYNPKVISVWFTGEIIPEIETMDEDVLLEGVFFVFEKFLGKSHKIIKPDEIKRAAWYSNPHFRGTYSFQTVSSKMVQPSPSSNQILSEPINDEQGVSRLLFAGEATNPIRFSTVHGAIDSGYREAERLIKLYKK